MEDVLKKLEGDPLNPDLWFAVREAAKARGDFLSAKTLPVILTGLEHLCSSLRGQSTPDIPTSALLTGMQRAAFKRLATSYNNPKVLKEIGMLYVTEFKLPGVGRSHLERAKELNGSDTEIDLLIKQASDAEAKAAQRDDREDAGIERAQHAKKQVANLIRKTGKVALKAQSLADAAGTDKPPRPKAAKVLPKGAAPNRATAKIVIPAQILPLPESDDESVVLACKLIRDGELDQGWDVAIRLGARLTSDERKFELWTEVGLACFQTENYDHALKSYRMANDLAPTLLMSWFNYGLALQIKGRFDESLRAYLMGDSLEPNHPKVWCNIGALYFQTDQFQKSEEALRKAVEFRPSYARAWDNLAAALGAQEKLLEARYACQRAISLRSDFPESWFKLAMIHLHYNELSEAKQAYQNALTHESLAPFALNFLAIIEVRQGNLEQATRHAHKAAELDPDNESAADAWTAIGEAYLKAEHLEPAITALRTAAQANRANFSAWYNLGRAYYKGGQLAEARDAFSAAIATNPQSYAAIDRLGRVALELGDVKQAVDMARQLTHMAPESEVSWRRLAEALEHAGDTAGAKDAKRKADHYSTGTSAEASDLTGALGRLRDLAR
jgi:tetratricopeptide (TPR) repeat protein